MVKLQNFLRYEIYPEGRVYDTQLQSDVLFNKHLNFAWYTDEGEQKFENLRSLIKFLVDENTPEFTEYLPEYKPPTFFNAIVNKPEAAHISHALAKAKKLHDLRMLLKVKTEAVLDPLCENFALAKEEFIAAKALLSDFKTANPFYYQLPPYADIPKEQTPEEIQQCLDKEIELKARIAADFAELEILKSKHYSIYKLFRDDKLFKQIYATVNNMGLRPSQV